MGRQVAIAATIADEEAFLDFVRTNADIRIAESAAPSLDTLWVEQFSTELACHRQYWIWNRQFDWTPEYGRVNDNAPGTGGWYYLGNAFQGPLVQFSRSDLSIPSFGRLYWSKDFAAPNGLDYDVELFSI